MKHLLFFIILLFPLLAKSQINIQIDYNKKENVVFLMLENKTDKIFDLTPMSQSVFPETENYSIIYFTYKNKEDSIICKGSWIVPDWQWINENGHRRTVYTMKYLLPYAKNKYVYDLTEICNNKKSYKLDIYVQLKAMSIKEKKMYLIDKQQTFLW